MKNKSWYRVYTKTRLSANPTGKNFRTPATARKYVAGIKNLKFARIINMKTHGILKLRRK